MAKISIIMGIYNCANTLPEAIDSILQQTYKDWEIVLCDDGSSDETYEVASDYQKQYPEKIILLRNESNTGLNHTLNRCCHPPSRCGYIITQSLSWLFKSSQFNRSL